MTPKAEGNDRKAVFKGLSAMLLALLLGLLAQPAPAQRLALPLERGAMQQEGLLHWFKAVPGLAGGLTWYNLASPVHHAMVVHTGSPWEATARRGGHKHLRLNGSSEYAEIAGGLVTGPLPLSFTAWVSPGTPGEFRGEIFSVGDYIGFGIDAIRLRGFYHYGGAWNTTDYFATFENQGWAYVAYTASDGAQALYVNGVQVATSAGTGPLVYTGVGSSSFIGKWGDGDDLYFPGALDNIKVFARYLSPAQILADYLDGLLGDTRFLRQRPRPRIVRVEAGASGRGGFFPFFE